MSTAVLLVVLALQYPHMWGFFAFLIVLDIVSHWYQMVGNYVTRDGLGVGAHLIPLHSTLTLRFHLLFVGSFRNYLSAPRLTRVVRIHYSTFTIVR